VEDFIRCLRLECTVTSSLVFLWKPTSLGIFRKHSCFVSSTFSLVWFSMSTEQDASLLQAASEGDLSKVQSLIEKHNANVNAQVKTISSNWILIIHFRDT
jgi:hypothetical protein